MVENYPTLIKIISFILPPLLLCVLLHYCSSDGLRKRSISSPSETQFSETSQEFCNYIHLFFFLSFKNI